MTKYMNIRTTAKELCSKAGVEFIGITDFGEHKLVMFNDPKTKTTLSINVMDMNVDNIKLLIDDSRGKWGV